MVQPPVNDGGGPSDHGGGGGGASSIGHGGLAGTLLTPAQGDKLAALSCADMLELLRAAGVPAAVNDSTDTLRCKCATAAVTSPGTFTGFASIQSCSQDSPALRAALSQPAQVDEAPKYGMGSRKHLGANRWKRARKGLLQQGAVGNLQGILNQQDALIPSSPSIVVLCQPQVAVDSPRSLLGCGERAPCASPGQGG